MARVNAISHGQTSSPSRLKRGAETLANERIRSVGGFPSGRGFPTRRIESPERTGCEN